MNTETKPLLALRSLRWRLLDAIDAQQRQRKKRIVASDFSAALINTLNIFGISVILQTISLPIYLAWSPQQGFDFFSRRSEKNTYLDSYAKFKIYANYVSAIALLALALLVINIVVLVFLGRLFF